MAREILIFPVNIVAAPLVLLIVLARPLVLLRFGVMRSERIGHFLADVEAYLCFRDQAQLDGRAFDFIGCPEPVCNTQVLEMWKRAVCILPGWRIWNWLDVACRYWSGGERHHVRLSGRGEDYKLISNTKAHLQFNEEEVRRGCSLLQQLGIPSGASWICIHNRDAAYLDKALHGQWAYHDYRNFSIHSMVEACDELARRGYFVLRIGSVVAEKLSSSNPMVIDYASSHLRSDFADIYLASECVAYIGSDSGIACAPFIFRKPVCYINFSMTQIPALLAQDMCCPFIVKRLWHEGKQRCLSLREMFAAGLAGAGQTHLFQGAGVEPVCNTPAEILDLAIEVDERLKGQYLPQPEDEELQDRFWQIYRQYSPRVCVGNIKARIGSAFLRRHVDLLN